MTRKENSGQFKRGQTPWNKGKKLPQISGKNHPNYKKVVSEKTRTKMREAKIGYIPWNKGKEFLQIKGENNPNWKGGITKENDKIRKSLEYEIWRKEIYKRDGWTCRLCGYKGKDIVAHHIKLFSEFPELRFSVDNGITLCRKCHIRIHKPAKLNI